MRKVISDTKHPIKLWLSDIEDSAEQQVRNLATLPFIFRHVAVMPDAHAGKGSTVGTVIATKGAIIPATVGVDIGCGMCAVELPFNIDQLGGDKKLSELRHSIERSVPVGHRGHEHVLDIQAEGMNDLGRPIADQYQTDDSLSKACKQLGTLGGGNHFIEICKDEFNTAWVMLHSGSRNIGKMLADIHINKAKGLMLKYFIDLPDPDLAFLAQGTSEFAEYIKDLHWAQSYAKVNRDLMMKLILRQVSRHVYGEFKDDKELTVFRVDCHHNYTQMENHFGRNVWVTRKGAVSARKGEFGIIPGSMGVKSFIVQGLGNAESFNSCSHGAGRRMSRTKARANFTVDDLIKQTANVECRKDDKVIDEIPGAYKDIEKVMNDQLDLVKPVHVLKQILCVKG